jgi:hypothetical protein
MKEWREWMYGVNWECLIEMRKKRSLEGVLYSAHAPSADLWSMGRADVSVGSWMRQDAADSAVGCVGIR